MYPFGHNVSDMSSTEMLRGHEDVLSALREVRQAEREVDLNMVADVRRFCELPTQ